MNVVKGKEMLRYVAVDEVWFEVRRRKELYLTA